MFDVDWQDFELEVDVRDVKFPADPCPGQSMKRRFGVDRVHIVGHSKGGLDARCHVKYNNHVETLIMLATPNVGSFIEDIGERGTRGAPLIRPSLYFDGFLDLTTAAVESLNRSTFRNRRTNYVTVAGDYDSTWATRFATFFGPNDEIVAVDSVEALSYPDARTYLTSEADPISQGICRTLGLFNHSCLRYNTRVVDELFPLYLAVLTPPLPAPASPPPRPAGCRRAHPPAPRG